MSAKFKKQTGDNREKILSAGEQLFAVKGYAATSVREILRRANVSNPMLYYYFGSKRDLLLTLLTERLAEFFRRVDDELALVGGLEPVLERYAELVIEGIQEQPTTLRFLFSILYGPQVTLPQDEIREEKTKFARILPSHIQRTANGAPEERVALVACLFDGMLTSFVMQFLSGHSASFDAKLPQALAARAVRMMDDDIYVPEIPFYTGLITEESE